ncbi:MAG: AAA family ATPase [Burkholderiaceae bacterium]|nr:AAA family ATPase [Burkholderiaceae bacterium]
MALKPKVALSNDFLLQLSKLPAKVHSKIMKWATQFQADPTSTGINYENIHSARDANLKSVRLDDDWRGIVFKPAAGDVYVLLYVDHHDDAYRWAKNRKLAINPVTGAMQLVNLEQVTEQQANQAAPLVPTVTQPASLATASTLTPPLFADFSDYQLMSLGVPAELLKMVRCVMSDAQLDALQAQLPVEAYEGLFLLAAGDDIEGILNARETDANAQIDLEDFATALTTPESQSRFKVVSDDETLLSILNAPLAQWRVFLHPTQKKLAEGDRSGPVRVLGGAGTGKTVLAMHRAKWLAEHRTPAGQKVLLTTFTRNLSSDIEQNLKTLCEPEVLKRLEVTNLDAWVHAYMRKQKLEHRIVYDRTQEGAAQAWQSAMAVRDTSLDLPNDFYEQEFEQIVLAQGITTLEEYRIARRIGRGVVLSRSKRDAVWPVFDEYRGQLASRKLKDVNDAYRELAHMLTNGQQAGTSYSGIIVDESQDFGPQALKLLRAMVPSGPNDLLFVGDGHQRIYHRNKAAMSQCGIDIRGRSKKLYINYRTTDEIRRQAVALLEGVDIDDLDNGQDESQRYRSLSHGPIPAVLEVDGLEKASTEVLAFLKQWQSSESEAGLTYCVIAANEKTRDTLSQQLQKAGVRTVCVTAQSSHTDERNVVYLSTMHRAKGLEFDCVAVVAPQSYLDEKSKDNNQRQLLYVALTRAKRGATLLLT